MSQGTIHDLGYKRYAGTRQSTGTRWRVVMRQQIASAWKTWFRYKAWVGFAVVITCVAGMLMYLATYVPNLHVLNDMLVGGHGNHIELADVPLPNAIAWYCRGAFLCTLTLSIGVIANDMRSGAFTFYFSRSLRPTDYVLGKLAGLGFVMATITMAGPVLLAIMRLTLATSTDELWRLLPVVPKAFAIGALTTLTYAALPLAFSALLSHRGYALAAWVAYYVIAGEIVSNGLSSTSAISALDLPTAIRGVAFWVFDVQPIRGTSELAPIAACVVSLAVQITAALAIAYFMVRRASDSGVGGAT